jgi:hypothetical protein
MSAEKEILQKLVISKDEVRKSYQELVERAMKVFRIESETGKIIFQDYASLTDQAKICAVLLGKYFASELGIIQDNSLSMSDLSKEVGKPITTVSARLTDLIKNSFVEALPTRKYRIVYPRISEILDSILKLKTRK